MKSKFLSFGLLCLVFVEFDTEDNIVRSTEHGAQQWVQNLDLDTWQPLSDYGLRRYSQDKMWFKTSKPVKSIRLNNFPLKYKVKKISATHFEIYCPQLQRYFGGTDNIEVIVKK